ncbi:MAG: response regulator [Bacteroidia bacterium]|nr:response regulator [Bacteroidia bacterium]
MSEERTHRILVVDDEPDVELLISQKYRREIRKKTYAFEFANNGQSALDILTHRLHEFDAVLTDINMPEMDGLTLLMKVNELDPQFKTVVVSAYGDLPNIREAMNRGAFDFVTKPIDFGDLQTTLDKTIKEVDLLRQVKINKDKLDNAIVEKDRALQSEKFKQQFLANMSHEIRTPMNAIIGMTNLVLKSELTEQQLKYLSGIKMSSQNLLVIINDILDFSKIEAGKIELERIPFNMAETVNHIHDTLQFKAEEKKLDLIVKIADDVPKSVMGDPVRLNQILLNLTGNSIKFTESGSVSIVVEKVADVANGAEIRFSVVDTGIGIEADKVDKVFESFSQASQDTTRKYGGTGLGLTITKELVELHGGKIAVKSEFGKGTTFYCDIPYEISEIAVQEESADAGDTVELSGIKILLVEDNDFNQIVAVDTLEETIKDVSVDIAANGKIAIDMVLANSYDLVLMDIQMPEMNGFEATKAIRKLTEEKRGIPIIAMTANAARSEVEECINSGMNDHVPKPFETSDLLKKIKNQISK